MEGRIGKKEYLGRNDLREFVVPPEVEEIGDWAFAQCACLKRIAIPATIAVIGRSIFEGCDALTRIFIYASDDHVFMFSSCTARDDVLAELTAYAWTLFPSAVLMQPDRVGTDVWLDAWNAACMTFLQGEDDIGFSPFLAGGEEDYAEQLSSRSHYESVMRRKKADVVLTRLRAEAFFSLRPEDKEQYASYLKSNREAYAVLKDCTDHMRETVAIFEELGLLSGTKTEELIRELPEEAVELRALLMERANEVPDFQL